MILILPLTSVNGKEAKVIYRGYQKLKQQAIMYEKQYNRDAKGGYNKGGKQRSPVPIKPLLLFLFLLILIILGFSYRKQIIDMLVEWKDMFVESTKSDVDENVDVAEDNESYEVIVKAPEDESLADMMATITELDSVLNDGKLQDSEKSEFLSDDFFSGNTNKATKPTIEATDKPVKKENLSKHKFERFVDQETNKYGLRDLTAKKVLISPVYDEIKPLAENQKVPYAIVRKAKLWGVVTVNNETIVPVEHTHIDEHFVNNYVLLRLTRTNEKVQSVNGYARMPDAKIIIPAQYVMLTAITRDYTFFKVSNSNFSPSNDYGVIDWNNNMIFPMEHDYVKETRIDGYVTIQIRTGDRKKPFLVGLAGLKEGKLLVPIEYEELNIMGPLSCIKVKKDGKYGCINHHNEVIVPIIYGGGGGSKESYSDPGENIIYFYSPDEERVAYNMRGEKVPLD